MQQPCKFPAATADAAFNRALGDAEDLRYFFVIHIFEVAEYNRFAEFRRELLEGGLDLDLELSPATWCSWEGRGSARRPDEGGAVLFAVDAGVHGTGGAVQTGSPEVVDQEVAGKSGYPGVEAALRVSKVERFL